METTLFKIINYNYYLHKKKKCESNIISCDNYLKKLAVLLKDKNIFDNLINCTDGLILDNLNTKTDVGAGLDPRKITFFIKKDEILFAVKFLRSITPDVNILQIIRGLTKKHKNLFMHAEQLIAEGICNTDIIREKIGKILDKYCQEKKTKSYILGPCAENSIEHFKSDKLKWFITIY
jgi:hypothetical protein